MRPRIDRPSTLALALVASLAASAGSKAESPPESSGGDSVHADEGATAEDGGDSSAKGTSYADALAERAAERAAAKQGGAAATDPPPEPAPLPADLPVPAPTDPLATPAEDAAVEALEPDPALAQMDDSDLAGPQYWLSVELIGPRGAQLDAAESLLAEGIEAALPRGGQPLAGEPVGRVRGLDAALRWIDANAFGDAGTEGAAFEAPGGALLSAHDVVMTAFVITAASPSGGTLTPGQRWPRSERMALPEGVDWRPAELTLSRTPLFAAPSPTLPPAAERYLVVEARERQPQALTPDSTPEELAAADSSEQAVWIRGERVEACDAGGVDCLHWVQVIVRNGDRFQVGWLPAHLAIPKSAWTLDAARGRRYAIAPAHRESGSASFVLLERRGDALGGRRLGFEVPHAGADWPEASLALLADTLTVHIGGRLVHREDLGEGPPSAVLRQP